MATKEDKFARYLEEKARADIAAAEAERNFDEVFYKGTRVRIRRASAFGALCVLALVAGVYSLQNVMTVAGVLSLVFSAIMACVVILFYIAQRFCTTLRALQPPRMPDLTVDFFEDDPEPETST